MQGGSHPLFQYGWPVKLLGSFLFPLFQEYSVAVLTGLALPFLWVSSKKLYNDLFDLSETLSNHRIVFISSIFAVMNPLTYRTIFGPTFPFLWGVVLGLFSLHFYMVRKRILAIIVGILAVFIHPTTGILLGSILLVDFRPLNWLKTYFLPVSLFIIQLGIFFGLFKSLHSPGSELDTFYLHNLPILIGVLTTSYLVKKETKYLSLIGIIGTITWTILGIFGFWIPIGYFDRIAYFIILLIMPYLIRTILQNPIPKIKPPNISKKSQYLIIPAIIALVFLGAYGQLLTGTRPPQELDNESRDEIGDIVGNESVYLASKGPELYELPRFENITFTNKGKFPHHQEPTNITEYIQMLKNQNASFILANGETPDNKTINKLNLTQIHSEEELKLYKIKSYNKKKSVNKTNQEKNQNKKTKEEINQIISLLKSNKKRIINSLKIEKKI